MLEWTPQNVEKTEASYNLLNLSIQYTTLDKREDTEDEYGEVWEQTGTYNRLSDLNLPHTILVHHLDLVLLWRDN